MGQTVWGLNPGGGQKFSLLIPIQTGPEAYPASSMMVIGTSLGEEWSWHGFATHPLLVLRLKIGSAIILPPHCACIGML